MIFGATRERYPFQGTPYLLIPCAILDLETPRPLDSRAEGVFAVYILRIGITGLFNIWVGGSVCIGIGSVVTTVRVGIEKFLSVGMRMLLAIGTRRSRSIGIEPPRHSEGVLARDVPNEANERMKKSV